MTPAAEKLALEILQICSTQGRSTLAGKLINRDKIISQFSSSEKPGVKSVINNYLLKMKYLEKTNDSGSNPTYLITQRGELHISSHSRGASITIGNNSNAAINSPGTTQSLSINNQTLEIQRLVTEFDEAVRLKDSTAMKKVFGYIADKSVDVAIAIVTGSLLR